MTMLRVFRAGTTCALAACMALALLACDSEAPGNAAPAGTSGTPGAAGKPAVGVLVYKKDDAYIALVSDALQRALGDAATVTVLDARSDQILQNDQFAEQIQAKAAALAVNMVDTQNTAAFVDQAKKAGIPLIFFNREPDLDAIKAYDKASFVGTVAKDAGVMQGDIVHRLWTSHPEYDRNKDGVFQYAMFQGNPDNPEALARTEYSVRRAVELGVNMRQVGETHVCNWDEGMAREAMALALAAGDSVELVLANNDAMALGAIAALAEQGHNLENGDPAQFIPVVGVDAVPQAVEAINKGVMSATVRQDAEGMGRAVAALTLNAMRGKPFLEGLPYAWDASGVAVRIPYTPYDGAR